MEIKNLFKNISSKTDKEIIENIISNKNFKVERIISEGHKSPIGFWYDQPTNEFVLLLEGSAELNFEYEEPVILERGDYIIIPARKRHRIERTDLHKKTFWLTIHY